MDRLIKKHTKGLPVEQESEWSLKARLAIRGIKCAQVFTKEGNLRGFLAETFLGNPIDERCKVTSIDRALEICEQQPTRYKITEVEKWLKTVKVVL